MWGNWSSSSPEESLTLLSTQTHSGCVFPFQYLSCLYWSIWLLLGEIYATTWRFQATHICACVTPQDASVLFTNPCAAAWRTEVAPSWQYNGDARCAGMLFLVTASLCKLSKVCMTKKGRTWSLSSLPQGSSCEHRKKIRNLLIWQTEW